MLKILKKYKKPIIILILNFIIYNTIGGPTNDCGSRCPMPNMSKIENFLFVFSYLIDFLCITWILIISLTEQE